MLLFKAVKKNIILYFIFFKKNLKVIATYEFDVVFAMVGSALNTVAQLFLLFVISQYILKIDGYTLPHLLLIYGLSEASFSLWRCLYIHTISLPYFVRTGELDQFLLRPVSPLFQIMTYGFDEDAWGDLLVALVIITTALVQLQSMWYMVLVPVLIVSGSLVFAGISLFFSMLSFWTIGHNDMANVVYDMKEFTKYPMALYNAKVKWILTLIFPLIFVASFPSELINQGTISAVFMLIVGVVWSLGFFTIVKMLWYYCFRSYQSTGS